jgi:GNAT superfamily N-acetyltransferase
VSDALIVRPYASADRRSVREICVRTAWLGGEGEEIIPDDWIWAEVLTRHFTDVEPEHATLVERTSDRAVVGYLLGTCDVRAFEKRVIASLPRILLRSATAAIALRPRRRRAALALLRSLAKGELVVPERVRERCPATFRFNVLPEARGRGLGARLLDRYLEQMRALSLEGVHVQTLSENQPAAAILQRARFQLAAEWPITAFDRVSGPMRLLTWVRFF